MWYTNLLNEKMIQTSIFSTSSENSKTMLMNKIGMSMTQLGGDIFINFILAAVGEILGYFYNLIVADFWGRKPTLISG